MKRTPLWWAQGLAVLAGVLAACSVSLAEDVDTAWVRDYNSAANKNDIAYDVVLDGAGYTYVTGGSPTTGHTFFDNDVVTIKYDAVGDTVWLRRLNMAGDPNESGNFIALTDDNHLIIAGTTNANDAGDILIIKYTTDGDTVWTRTWGGSSSMADYPTDLVFANVFGGEYLITGDTFDGTGFDMFTLCYATNGTLLWAVEYDEAGGYDRSVGIDYDASGNVYVEGYSETASNQDAITIKYTPAGVFSWRKLYNGPDNINDQGVDLAVDANGDIVTLAISSTSVAINDFVVIKYQPDGDTSWVRRFDGPGSDNDTPKVLSVVGTDIYVGGDVNISPGITRLGLFKYTSSGDTAWARFHAPLVNARDMSVDGSGSIFLTGDGLKAGTFWSDYGTFKFTPAGDTAWFRWLQGPLFPGGPCVPYALAVDGLGGVVVTGSLSAGTLDYSTAHYVPACSCPYQDDFDQDGFVTALDLSALIDILFAGQPDIQDASCPSPRGDADCDGFSTALDLSITIDYLFAGGTPPCDPCSP